MIGEETANNTWNISKAPGISIVNGPYLGGNYWVHPYRTGFSIESNDTDMDYISDIPYVIDENNTDYLPLIIKDIPAAVSRSSGGSSGNHAKLQIISAEGKSTKSTTCSVTKEDSTTREVHSGDNIGYSFTDVPVPGITFEAKEYKGSVAAL